MSVKEDIDRISTAYGLNPLLITAICKTESAMDPWAARFEPAWGLYVEPKKWSVTLRITENTEKILQATSWGLMQTMGAVAREEGFTGPLPKLCIPEVGLEIGCKKFRKLMDRHGDLRKALEAYNAGKPGTALGAIYSKKVIEAMG